MSLAVAGHQFKGIKQLNIENKLNQFQNFPDQPENDFTKMREVVFEKFFRKFAQEGATLGLLAVG